MVIPFLPFLVQGMEHRCSVRPSISGTVSEAPMVSPFLLFLEQRMEHRMVSSSFYFWCRGWSINVQSVLIKR
jgi:hypothetical protein